MTVIGIIVAGVALVAVLMYNNLVGKRNQVENVFAGIDATLKKRYDLVPNLVSTVKTYMQHERQTLTDITEMRARAVSGAISTEEKVALDTKITRAIGGIMVAVENYPDLKANESFMQLQRSLNEIEEQLSAARRAYNATVTDYNNSVEMFPTALMASLLQFKRKTVFEISAQERQNVNVATLFNA